MKSDFHKKSILTHNRLMYKIAINSIKLPFASITASMPSRFGLSSCLEFLLDPFNQFVLHVAWNLVSASLNRTPHKKVHQIQVWQVWRPNMRRDKINEVVAQLKLCFSQCMAGCQVLLPHI